MSIHISFFCLSWLSSFSVFSVIFIFIFNRSAFLLLFCCVTGDLTRRSDHTCRYICSTPVRFKMSRSFAFTKHFSMGSSSRLADQCDTFNCRPFSIFAPIQMLIFSCRLVTSSTCFLDDVRMKRMYKVTGEMKRKKKKKKENGLGGPSPSTLSDVGAKEVVNYRCLVLAITFIAKGEGRR